MKVHRIEAIDLHNFVVIVTGGPTKVRGHS